MQTKYAVIAEMEKRVPFRRNQINALCLLKYRIFQCVIYMHYNIIYSAAILFVPF